jgi:hypothetical protein
VIHVEQRSNDNRKHHQNDVDLDDERGQKIGQRSKWIVGEHHYLQVSLRPFAASNLAAFGGFQRRRHAAHAASDYEDRL